MHTSLPPSINFGIFTLILCAWFANSLRSFFFLPLSSLLSPSYFLFRSFSSPLSLPLLSQIYSVGVGVPLLITHEHSKVWLYSNVEGNKVSPLHPWTSVVLGEVNTNLLGKLEKKLVSYIISDPGVTLVCPVIYLLFHFPSLSLTSLSLKLLHSVH